MYKTLCFCLLLPTLSFAKTLHIVATLPDLAAVAKEVGGNNVDVASLSKPTQDPHHIDARPNLMLLLNRADFLIVDGLDLEIGWLPKLQVGARNPNIQLGQTGYLDVSTVVEKLQVPQVRIDRSMGDVHPGGNPHFTFDPRAVKNIAKAIAERLAQLNPQESANYQQRYQNFAKQLDDFSQQEQARFKTLPAEKKRVVQYHMSLNYLFNWLNLENVATIEPLPGIPPNPNHVAKVLETMRHTQTKVIILEQYFPQSDSQTLAKLANAKCLIILAGTRFEEGQSYIQHIQEITQRLYTALTQ